MESKVRSILYITARSDMGGGPQHLADLLEGMVSLGLPCKIFVAAPTQGAFFDRFRVKASKTFTLPHRKFSFFRAMKLLNFCRAESVSLVHSHGRGAGLYSRFLALFGFPVVHSFHGVHVSGSWKERIKGLVDRMLAPFASRYICVSASEELAAIEAGLAPRGKTSVIINGVQAQRLVSNISKDEERESLSLPSSSFVLGTLARLDPIKDTPRLVDYVRRYRRERDEEVCLAIAGQSGESRDGIYYLGELSDVSTFLQAIDFYVSSSKREGLPLAPLEALATGHRCLLSNVPGHRDICKLTDACELFERENYRDFSEKLDVLIKSGPLGEEEIESVQRTFSVDRMVEKTLKVYEEVLQ